MVCDSDAPLEMADNLLVRDFTRLVNLVIFKEGEPGLRESTRLASFDRNSDKGLIRVGEELPVILKLILVELAVMEVCHACFSLFFCSNCKISIFPRLMSNS